MTLDADTCYRALVARDRRFDGLFFVGVSTTGVYCRPVCPARTPRRERCSFFARAAEAEREGFRACFRCRPELAPGGAPVDALPRLVASALARIDAGCLNEGSVDGLAAELGVSGRHLHRALTSSLGLSPIELAQTRRLALAKQLLQDTSLSLTDVALAAGFASIRRFNAVFAERFGRPPSALRRAHGEAAGDGIVLRLDHRPPLDWEALLEFLAARAIPGVEVVADGAYRRTVALRGHVGWVQVAREHDVVRAHVASSLAPVLAEVVARVRAVFDLDAHPSSIDAALSHDPLLRPLVRARPGVRLVGAFDGFETALRAVLGQQVSVRGATTLAGRLAARLGTPVATPFPELRVLWPAAAAVGGADAARLAREVGLPGKRAATIVGLARAVSEGGLRLERHADPDETVARLVALPGIGDWTAQYLGMRVLGWPDAFPASDLGLLRALDVTDARAARTRAEAWRPWRAYAAMRLWMQHGSTSRRGGE